MREIIPLGSISMISLLDKELLEKITETAGAKMWRGFMIFGSASTVLIIFIIIRLTKLIVDTPIHGYALHSIYG